MTTPADDDKGQAVTAEDVARAFGALDAATIATILALGPTPAEIEEAALWVAGEGETLTRRHQPRGTVKAILDIVRPEAEEENEHRT